MSGWHGWHLEVDPNVTVTPADGRFVVPVNVFRDHKFDQRLDLSFTAEQIALIHANVRGHAAAAADGNGQQRRARLER
jgi:hypothetical protein